MKKKLNIALAEDNSFLAQAISENLSLFDNVNLKIIAQNGEMLLKKLQKDSNIDVILMDIEMPVLNGIEATLQVKNLYPHIKVVMLTVFDDDQNIYQSILAGAEGYLLKDTPAKDLNLAIIETSMQKTAISPAIATKTFNLIRRMSPPETFSTPQSKSSPTKLTKREKEVLLHLSKGLSYQQVAKNLIISEHTVRKHIENLYKKLGATNKMEAVIIARQHKIIE